MPAARDGRATVPMRGATVSSRRRVIRILEGRQGGSLGLAGGCGSWEVLGKVHGGFTARRSPRPPLGHRGPFG